MLIGGLAGGGAGAAGAGLTGNRDLDIPAESIVHFKLAQDLVVQGEYADSQPESSCQLSDLQEQCGQRRVMANESILGGSELVAFAPTTDPAKARAFYEGVLGLRTGGR